jgi:hypothetical protein
MAVALSIAAVFVVVIPASVQEEGGWQLPGLGSSHRPTPLPVGNHTVPVAVTTAVSPAAAGR